MGRAQARRSAKVYRLAIVELSTPVSEMNGSGEPSYRAFVAELKRLGYVEGQNVVIERFSGEGRAFRNPKLARGVVRSNPDVIYAIANPMVLDLKAATTSIPIPSPWASSRASRGRAPISRGLGSKPSKAC
jgi:putative tryptophan/tyrosine transport system substrate-binding protein